jgi:protein-S-isoprenylcysteine O-methyltransferase Ste14
MILLNQLTLFLSYFLLISFFLAAFFYFKHPDAHDKRKLLISASAGILTFLNLYLIYEQRNTAGTHKLASLLLYIMSCYFFWGSILAHRKKINFAFSSTNHTSFVSHGTYRFVRHPIYFSYQCAWWAGAIYCNSLTLLIFSFWLLYLYYSAAKVEELEFSTSGVSNEYKEYSDKTKMLIPFLI